MSNGTGDPTAPLGDAENTRKQNRGYRALGHAAKEYAMWTLDSDGRVDSWNDGGRRLFGYRAEDILGEHVSLLYPDDAIDRDEPNRGLRTAEERGDLASEGWRVREDGTRFWAAVDITSIGDDGGALDGYAVVIRDLTERTRRDRELQRYETILEAVGDPVYELDEDGRYVFVNDAFVEQTGYPREELLGEHVSMVLPEEDVERGTAIIRQLLRDPDRRTATWELTRITASGRRVPVENHLALLPFDEHDRFAGTAGVIRDITERKERERRLDRRKSELETELGEILGRISDAFYALDAEFRFTHVNERTEELLGRSRDELLGERVWDVFPEARETVIWDRYHEALETQDPVSVTLFYEPLDGWFEVNAYPSATGLSAYFRDVTERVERKRALERYEQIVETVSDGVYALDDDHRFVLVNDAFCRLLGYDREALLGRHPAFINRSAVTEADELHQEIIAGERTTGSLEADLETAAGDTVPVEVRFGSYEYAAGRYGRCGVVRDVTERVKHERALAESERRFRTVFEETFNAMLLADDAGTFVEANPAASDLLGVDREDLLGRSISTILPDDSDYGQQWQGFLDEGALQGRVPLVRPDGENRVAEFTATANVLPGRHLAILQDVTERTRYRRRLETTIEKLEASNERLEQFAYISSHDLQEPLRTISNFLQLLADRYRDELDADAHQFIDFAVDATDRMRAMINDLLRYSRIDSRANPLEPTDVDAVVDRVLDRLRLQIEETDASISVGPLPTVVADENQLEQVVQNLVSNAIKYRGEIPPLIEIGAERRGDEWVVWVSDNGIGIPPDRVDRIFDVFKRLHTHEEYPGTGIGLALCEKIVDRHGGEIWVESEPGVGSTFSFTLPATDGGT